MLGKRRELAESVRKTVSDAGALLASVAVIAVSALLMGLAAMFMALRARRAA